MKLRSLRINGFGHFQEFPLEIPSDGFQVVYGPNEAGKTTLLEFIRGWLFDFPARTSYGFNASVEIGGAGTMTLSDNRQLELRRRKRNKNKIAVKIDGREVTLDDVGLQRLLGNANRNLFESVFAFGLQQLAEGEESLKHESLQSALFGGGLGTTISPEKISESLGEQAQKMFNPAARSKSAVSGLLSELKELNSAIRTASVRTEDYRERSEAARQCAQQVTELGERVEQLRGEHSRLDRLVRAFPKWHLLQQKRQERAPLSAPAGLPDDAQQRDALLAQRLNDVCDRIASLEQRIRETEQRRSALTLEPRILACRAEIQACTELKTSYVEAQRDLPDRIRQRDDTRKEIDRELSELRPGWTPDDLRSFSIDAATSAELERFERAEQEQSLEEGKLATDLDNNAQRRNEAQAQLEALGPPRDVAAIAAVLRDEPIYSAAKAQRDAGQRNLAKQDRTIEQRRRKLTPLLPADAPAPQTLPVPRVEVVEEVHAWFAATAAQCKAETDGLHEHENDFERLREMLAEVTDGRDVPSLQDRDAARQRRDLGWDLVRARFVEGAPRPDQETVWLGEGGESLVESYAESVTAADQVADRIYDHADAVTKRESICRQVEAAEQRIAARRQRIEALQAEEAVRRAAWQALWAPCGIEPSNPAAMRRWLDDYASYCEAAAARDEMEAEWNEAQARLAAFATRLQEACGVTDGDFEVLLAKARQTVEQVEAAQRRRDELGVILVTQEQRIAATVAKQQSLAERQTASQAAWRTLLEKLRLPESWSITVTRNVIGRLSATRVKLDSVPRDEARIVAMQDRIADFESKVRALCETLAPNLLREPPALVADKLSEQYDRAAKSQQQDEQWLDQLRSAREEHQRQTANRESLLAERRKLHELASATTDHEFRQTVAAAMKLRALETEIAQLERDLDAIRAGADRADFESQLSQIELGVLEGRRRDAAEALRQAEDAKSQAAEAAGAAKNELARLDGSEAAAALAEKASRKRAQLADEVERYVPLFLAKHLLNEAIRRFERENQPAMIKSVSQLLGKMTAGRYVEFDRVGGGNKGILVRRADGAERTPEQLSSGTREQLYLAIRLAYVQHYCGQNEPLPIIMDDVLVNFDDDRVRQTFAALADVAAQIQVLFFTCHPHMVQLAREVFPDLTPLNLPALG